MRAVVVFFNENSNFHLSLVYFSCHHAVSLEGILRASHGLTHKFIGFFLAVEKSTAALPSLPSHLLSIDGKDSSKAEKDVNVGKFHITMGAISKFSDRCDNLVTHTNLLPKSDVPVMNNKLNSQF
jgi:hypothetical protein